MASKKPLGKREIDRLTQMLEDLEEMRKDIEMANQAGVPGMEQLQRYCDKCEDRAKALMELNDRIK